MEPRVGILFVFIITASALELYTPRGKVMKPQGTFILKCVGDQSDTVQIERHLTDKTWVIIGSDGQMHEPFVQHPRYSMYAERHLGIYTYTFEIKGTTYEDTAFYRCKLRLPPAQRLQSQEEKTVLAICDNIDSAECGCIQRMGMIDPSCFRDAETVETIRSRNQSIITGLIVCLVIAVLIAIGFAVVAGLDCSRKMHEKRKKAAAKAASEAAAKRARRSMYDETEQLQLDPNDLETNPYYSNAGYTDDNSITPATESRPNGTPGSRTQTRNNRPNDTPGSKGVASGVTSTSNTPIRKDKTHDSRDALDPRNLSAFQFPSNNNSHRNSPMDPTIYSQPGKSPGDFSIASGDLDMLKTPVGYSASPRDPYSKHPSTSSRDHHATPRRLEFINQTATPMQTHDSLSPDSYDIKPSTII